MQHQTEQDGPDQQTPAERVERIFAVRMRELREQAGMSQAALARDLRSSGITLDSTAITRIEKNGNEDEAVRQSARVLRLGEAWAIARHFGRTLDEMMESVRPLDEQLKQAEADLQRALNDERAAQNAQDQIRQRAEETRERVDRLRALMSSKEG